MGTFHTLALDSTGQVWSAGSNNHGQLGRDGVEVPFNRFGKVKQAGPYQDVCAGNNKSFFIEAGEGAALHYCGKMEGMKSQAVPTAYSFFKNIPIKQVDCG